MRTIPELKTALLEAASEERFALVNQIWGELCGEIAKDISIPDLERLCKAHSEGRVVVLPCKVGDKLFEQYPDEEMDVGTVRRVNIEIESDIGVYDPSDIGETVFLAPEEAKAAIE